MNSVNNIERFRARLEEGKICVGTSVQVCEPLVTEIAAQAGNDFIWIEMEHCHMSNADVMGHIMACRGTNAAPLVRISHPDKNLIKPFLDMAPAGIIVSMIENAQQAREAVRACRYPPHGDRGFGPIRNMYGIDSMADYLAQAEAQFLVILHIECISAVHELDEILAIPGVDGISLGRNDLSGSMNKLGQHSDPQVLEAIDTVITKSVAAGKYLGCSIGPDLDQVREWRAKGMSWFSLGEELGHIFDGAKAVADAVHEIE